MSDFEFITADWAKYVITDGVDFIHVDLRLPANFRITKNRKEATRFEPFASAKNTAQAIRRATGHDWFPQRDGGLG